MGNLRHSLDIISAYRMIKGHRINDHELCQVIFIRIVVAMPAYNIKRGVVLQKTRHS